VLKQQAGDHSIAKADGDTHDLGQELDDHVVGSQCSVVHVPVILDDPEKNDYDDGIDATLAFHGLL